MLLLQTMKFCFIELNMLKLILLSLLIAYFKFIYSSFVHKEKKLSIFVALFIVKFDISKYINPEQL